MKVEFENIEAVLQTAQIKRQFAPRLHSVPLSLACLLLPIFIVSLLILQNNKHKLPLKFQINIVQIFCIIRHVRIWFSWAKNNSLLKHSQFLVVQVQKTAALPSQVAQHLAF